MKAARDLKIGDKVFQEISCFEREITHISANKEKISFTIYAEGSRNIEMAHSETQFNCQVSSHYIRYANFYLNKSDALLSKRADYMKQIERLEHNLTVAKEALRQFRDNHWEDLNTNLTTENILKADANDN